MSLYHDMGDMHFDDEKSVCCTCSIDENQDDDICTNRLTPENRLHCCTRSVDKFLRLYTMVDGPLKSYNP